MSIGCPPFTSTAIDFLGPYKVKAMTVVFRCLNTGAVHIKLNKTYSTDALLLSITSFTSICGFPAKFYTDKGTQLSKAGSFINNNKKPANWTWDKIKNTLATKKTEVNYCLPGCQWQNGTAEQQV